MPNNPAPQDNEDFYHSLLRAYINSANDGIFVVCDEMKFHVANRLMASWLGETEATLTAHNQRIPITHFIGIADSKTLFTQQFKRVLAGDAVRFECRICPPKSQQRWVEISMNKVAIEGGDLAIGIVRDISERKMIMAEITRQAIHDDLTGLVNRREFGRRLDAMLDSANSHGDQHSLLYMDLDQFKVVNDTCGHLAGDELLRQISTLVKAKVRDSDTLARLGGDEFGVLLENCPVGLGMEIAEGIRQAVTGFRFHWQGKRFEVGVSIGVAPINAGSGNTAEVLSAADAACYVAKDKGRNRIQRYFGGKDCTHKRREMDWVSRIASALEENRFRLYYQYIRPTSEQRFCFGHREILLRMIDETGQIVAPTQFIPAAEKYNLMPSIDRWVIRTLFAGKSCQCQSMPGEDKSQEANCDVLCSVNLSGASLNDDSFLDFLRDQIAEHKIAPRAVCFEITETVAVNNLQRISGFIQEFKTLGFRFALDDFGSGMSSFTYLKSLAVDFLKIDGSLIREITRSKVDLCMVEAIHRIAQEMGIATIAEYVENDEILEKLVALGINYAQGYGIHRPEPIA